MDGGLPSWCWDEEAARRKLEDIVWADGMACPHCGEKERLHRMRGRSHRSGLWKCNACRQQFTATVGTPFHGSHMRLDKWFLAIHLLYIREPGASIRDVERWLGVTYKTAWNVAQRLKLEVDVPNHDLDEIVRQLCGL